ncbi:putative endo-beta-1,4-glucanase D [Zalerion maritima]|uniref:lytic cellulose monooxygenase (C4-dehydrogenating) n=1 Tax=Zalerion maritima TaxID=339359 RepID=A0AAD5WSA3_9PEZI|nr:putative endo-beta-1,4-glucanase D [Zalerion maritima]
MGGMTMVTRPPNLPDEIPVAANVETKYRDDPTDATANGTQLRGVTTSLIVFAEAFDCSASAAQAHYTFPSLIVNGQSTGDWVHVCKTANYQSNGLLKMLLPTLFAATSSPPATKERRQRLAERRLIAGTALEQAGSRSMRTAGILCQLGVDLEDPLTALSKVYTTIPSCIPSGDYLLRVEHIGLHSTSSVNSAQFYISCAQAHINGGGSTTLLNLVAFPGAFSPTDPGIQINIYYPIPTSYTNPGPPAAGPQSGAGPVTRL